MMDDWEINFKHHVGVHPNSLPITVAVASGKKDRKQMFFWIPEEYLDVLKRKDIKLENCGNFELRIGNNYSMVAGNILKLMGTFGSILLPV